MAELNRDERTGVALGVFVTIAVPILIAGAWIIDGLVLSILWRWFVVPLGVVPLSLTLAMGVGLTAGFLFGNAADAHEKDGDKILRGLVTRPALALVFGWIIHRFVGAA